MARPKVKVFLAVVGSGSANQATWPAPGGALAF
jgi:hypothetical protein